MHSGQSFYSFECVNFCFLRTDRPLSRTLYWRGLVSVSGRKAPPAGMAREVAGIGRISPDNNGQFAIDRSGWKTLFACLTSRPFRRILKRRKRIDTWIWVGRYNGLRLSTEYCFKGENRLKHNFLYIGIWKIEFWQMILLFVNFTPLNRWFNWHANPFSKY